MINLEKIIDVGLQISREKDFRKILEIILAAAMDITNCDAGTLYTIENNALNFTIMVTKSLGVYENTYQSPINIPPIPLSDSQKNICAACAVSGHVHMVDDVYQSADFNFEGPKRFDAQTGFRSQSVLTVPMTDDLDAVIGVIQLWNAQSKAGEIVPFSAEDANIVRTYAAQAAHCLASINYATQIRTLMDNFVQVLITAIEARTPYNANHTANMAKYAEKFIDHCVANNLHAFDETRRRAFLMAVWLHDIGKIIIPTQIMDKETRLGNRLETIQTRFSLRYKDLKIQMLEGNRTADSFRAETALLAETLAFIEQINTVGFLNDENLAKLQKIPPDLLTPNEKIALSVRKGTLTDDEREIMQGHVSYTAKMLENMHFPRDTRQVPFWASTHHEAVDGSGYPHRLSGDDLPFESRLLSIIDIYDALTACDRPYKPGMPPERAFSILQSMADEGKLDSSILQEFQASNAWVS